VERKIVHYDATTLVTLIRKRTYTASAVLTAFAKVAVVAQDLTNCLSEIFLDDAFRRAQELDKHMEETGNVVGPLHGLPVSVKDHIKIQGIDTSTGYICKLIHVPCHQAFPLSFLSAWAYKTVADHDALVVDILRKAGAILFVKTQNPQTLLVRCPCGLLWPCLIPLLVSGNK
jgi:amidase